MFCDSSHFLHPTGFRTARPRLPDPNRKPLQIFPFGVGKVDRMVGARGQNVQELHLPAAVGRCGEHDLTEETGIDGVRA